MYYAKEQELFMKKFTELDQSMHSKLLQIPHELG